MDALSVLLRTPHVFPWLFLLCSASFVLRHFLFFTAVHFTYPDFPVVAVVFPLRSLGSASSFSEFTAARRLFELRSKILRINVGIRGWNQKFNKGYKYRMGGEVG